jgi:hypothetical protein
MIWIICVVDASESCFYLSILEENDVLFINFYRKFNGWALLSTSYAIRPTIVIWITSPENDILRV